MTFNFGDQVKRKADGVKGEVVHPAQGQRAAPHSGDWLRVKFEGAADPVLVRAESVEKV